MISTIRAENALDVGARLGEISALTLVIGGGRDRFYPTELIRERAEGMLNAPHHLRGSRTGAPSSTGASAGT